MTQNNRQPTIGLGILSWNAPETLRRTLESYAEAGLSANFDKSLIFFNDITDADRSVAEEFGFPCDGRANLGITGGMFAMAERLDTDLILLLQNDLPLLEDAATTASTLLDVAGLIDSGAADFGYLRHRFQVGEGFGWAGKYLRYFPIHDLDPRVDFREHSNTAGVARGDTLSKKVARRFRGGKADRLRGSAVYLEREPERVQPTAITRVGDNFVIDSAALNYTDQSLLVRRSDYLGAFANEVQGAAARRPSKVRNGFFDAEPLINHGTWWRQQRFKIAVPDLGLFGHERKDGFSPA